MKMSKGKPAPMQSKGPTVKGATSLKQAAGTSKTQAKDTKTYQSKKSDPFDGKF